MRRWRVLRDLTDGAARDHLQYFTAYAEVAEPLLRGAEQQPWVARLEHDHDNVRAALRWAIDNRQAEPALRLSGALWRFWWIHGHSREGRHWLAAALDVPGAAPSAIRARALHGAVL